MRRWSEGSGHFLYRLWERQIANISDATAFQLIRCTYTNALKGLLALRGCRIGSSIDRVNPFGQYPHPSLSEAFADPSTSHFSGVSPETMAEKDERVSIEEFLHVVKVHTLVAFDYLSALDSDAQ